MMKADLLKLWKLKSRIHASLQTIISLALIPYVVVHGLVWSTIWRLLILLLLHQHLSVLSHRLLWHNPTNIRKVSALRAFLRGFITLSYIEGEQCVHAVHDTTQTSQHCEDGCLSEAVLWFSPRYLDVKDDSFISWNYILHHTALHACTYIILWYFFPCLDTGAQLWWMLILFNTPTFSRVLFYQGHSFLHHGEDSLLYVKTQNFTSNSYVRQAYNLHLRGDRSVSKYLLGFLFLGDHLHNNHHHEPGARYQAYTSTEMDGTWMYYLLLHRLGFIEIQQKTS